MSTVVPLTQDEHAAVQALLPWYARGRLGQAENDDVQRHLLHCAACRAELAAEEPMQTLLGAPAALDAAGDVEAGLSKLQARLTPPPARTAVPRWVGWALGAQGVAVAALLVLLVAPRSEAPAYRGLSAPGPATAADALVMFKPGTTEQALRELLQAHGARIVAGPTEAGAYQLQVDAAGLAGLRAAPVVAMAEPLHSGAAR